MLHVIDSMYTLFVGYFICWVLHVFRSVVYHITERSKMALAAKTARFALGRTVIDAQFLADSVIFMNSKYGMQRYVRHWFIRLLNSD